MDPDGITIEIERDFEFALDTLTRQADASLTLLPTLIASAVTQVIPVDGASLSIAQDGFRVPLGASDEASAQAERLQFTVGEGPCMRAIDTGTVVLAPEPVLQQSWPELADLWRTRVGFRSAVSHPLTRHGRITAALNLFFVVADGIDQLDMDEVGTVATCATAELVRALGDDLGAVPQTRGTSRRQQIWLAVGMGMNAWDITGPDALDRLRAHAYSRDMSLDDLAAGLIEHPDSLSEFDS